MCTNDNEPRTLDYAPAVKRSGRIATWLGYLGPVLIAGLCFILLIPSLDSRRRRMPAYRTICASNLGQIGRACHFYAQEHRGGLPPSLGVLLEGGSRAYLTKTQLICPKSQKPYIYIPGHRDANDPRNVIAYEPISYHNGQGGNMAFLDGHAKWCQAGSHAEQLKITRERMARAASQPVTTWPK